MAYSTINKSTAHFNTKLYTGTGSSNSVTGVGFQPDLCWIKNRQTTTATRAFDAVRGATKVMYLSEQDAEGTNSQGLTSFDSDGFTVGTSSALNGSGNNICSWNWKANGQGSANSDGTITTTYTSANTTAGFSIIKYTGNGTAGATVGHGLNSAPEFVITKKLSASANWQCWGSIIGNVNLISLNNATAKSNPNGNYNNDTNPNSTVVTLGNDNDINQNGEPYVMYCFHSVTGYSKIATYTGNANGDGAFVYTGFKPTFFLVKNTGSTDDWFIWDSTRDTQGNPVGEYLRPNRIEAEAGGNVDNYFDFVSNGIKMRNSNSAFNASSEYIIMAFGQSLVGSNNVPCTAR
jgi:hypothetical protein